jgi:PadR family transcriptional regulator, regulatory protein PadR
VKITPALERVLLVFLEDIGARRYGYDLMKAARLKSGTLYPMLARLQDEGLVTSEWEAPPDDGRPPRKYYTLTAEGARAARSELAAASGEFSRGAQRAARPAPGSAQ